MIRHQTKIRWDPLVHGVATSVQNERTIDRTKEGTKKQQRTSS